MREESKCERRLEFRKRGGLAVEGEKLQILKTYFGYDSFRPGQEEIIDQILGGRDALAIMPTGAGKSLCYQVPALMLSGITIVISPLISLMMDQVKALNEAGIHAAYINSSLTENQVAKALEFAKAGRYKIVYVAPERLETPRFLDFACHAEISMVTIDEAHCISQWGQDFRPSYVRIVSFIRQLPVRPIVTAFTATATKRVQTDIREVLKLQNPYVAVTGFDRENLYFEVQRTKEKKERIREYLEKHSDESGIIYCATRKNVDELYLFLESAGFSVGRYHAGMGNEARKSSQEDFIYDRIQVMIATNAPGSTYKMLTAAAGLTEGIVTADTTFYCTGVFDKITPNPKCWIYPGAHGYENVVTALRDSCNDYFYNIGYELGMNGQEYDSNKGTDTLAKYAKEFGLGEKSGVEIPESEPQISDEYSVQSAIGQGTNNFTVSQLNRYVAAVANRGTVYKLTLLDKTTDVNGKVIKEYEPEVTNTIDDISDNTWNLLHQGMIAMVQDMSQFNGMGISMAGKTGTAQQSEVHPDHVLFVGFAPAENPEIAVAVRIANGYSSAYTAEIGRDIVKSYYKTSDSDKLVTGKAAQLGAVTAGD